MQNALMDGDKIKARLLAAVLKPFRWLSLEVLERKPYPNGLVAITLEKNGQEESGYRVLNTRKILVLRKTFQITQIPV